MNTWGNYQNGVKSKEYEDIIVRDGFTLGYHSLIKHTECKPSHKFIYLILRSNIDYNTLKATVSIEKLSSTSGYSKQTVKNAIKKLESLGYIEISTAAFTRSKRGVNVYTFPREDGSFEKFTEFFIYNSKLTNAQKEFVVLLMPLFRENDTIGYTTAQIAKLIGMSRPTATKRIKELRVMGYVLDAPKGYTKFNLVGMMIDNQDGLLNENLRLNKKVMELEAKVEKLSSRGVYIMTE